MGLDPKSNRFEREAAQAEADTSPPLDPQFPFQPTPFDPWFFGLEQETPLLPPSPSSPPKPV